MVAVVVPVSVSAPAMSVSVPLPAMSVSEPESAVLPEGDGGFPLRGGKQGVEFGEFPAHKFARLLAALLAHGEQRFRLFGRERVAGKERGGAFARAFAVFAAKLADVVDQLAGRLPLLVIQVQRARDAADVSAESAVSEPALMPAAVMVGAFGDGDSGDSRQRDGGDGDSDLFLGNVHGLCFFLVARWGGFGKDENADVIRRRPIVGADGIIGLWAC